MRVIRSLSRCYEMSAFGCEAELMWSIGALPVVTRSEHLGLCSHGIFAPTIILSRSGTAASTAVSLRPETASRTM